MDEHPSLNMAVVRLKGTELSNYAVCVQKAPYPGGYAIENLNWTLDLSQIWLAWQGLFSPGSQPHCLPCHQDTIVPPLELETVRTTTDPHGQSYSSILMQQLGLNLWQWLFSGKVDNAFAQSYGIAIGQNKALRLRLDIRDPDLIALPWEIVRPQPGRPAIGIDRQVLFSRTTSDVDPLPPQRVDRGIKILLVLGQNSSGNHQLDLQQEAATIAQILGNTLPNSFNPPNRLNPAACQVDTLVQPAPDALIAALESQHYNVFFYAGHGMAAPNGGLLMLDRGYSLNGIELAQVLVRRGVKLAVFNTCWGAQPYQQQRQTFPRSSLAEVLLHHGVPAVLAMRDTIADREALSFIQTFTQALAHRMSIDEATAIARQQLLTLYKYNQPAWTLPILYMHPQFDGELIRPLTEVVTQVPSISHSIPRAYLRSKGADPTPDVPIVGGLMRLGRGTENDLVVDEPWVSLRHAEIIYRLPMAQQTPNAAYYLRDISRFGSYLLASEGKWLNVHGQEFVLESGMQLKFGSIDGQILEFRIDESDRIS